MSDSPTIINYVEFDKNRIQYVYTDCQFFIVIRSICKALGLNVDHHIHALKKEEILKDVLCVHKVRDTKNRTQKMVCLPERFIYGWLFQVRATNTMKSETKSRLITYKRDCYNVLYDHFHGIMSKRKNEIKANRDDSKREYEVISQLKELDLFKELQEIKKRKRERVKNLKELDLQLTRPFSQTEIPFNSN